MSSPPSSAGGLIGQRLGKYELVALLALGGTAEIYLARIGGVAGFEKYVVVKCLHDHLADDSEFVRMFLDEARLGAHLTHSNIVQTLELGEQKGRYYMVMDYVAGMSMSVIARKAVEHLPGGRLPVDLILGLMAQACSGLHYAHNRADSSGKPMHIVHRDVSPQNLVVTFDGMLKVVDFGIAKAAVRETQTQSGTIKGKFAYMSPEQCMGQPVDRRTDVFALGVVVHELLTGKRLFKRETAYDTYHAILECKVTPPSQDNHELDPALDSIVLKALAYDAKERYQSAEELGEALTSILHRRGKSVGAGDVAMFFDRHFATEISEHGQRMRALIAGRQTTTMDEYWNDLDDSESEARAKAGNGEVGSKSIDVNLDAVLPREPSEVSLLDSNLLEEVEMEEDDDAGGGATRVELNPLQRVENLHSGGNPGASTSKTVSYPATRGAAAMGMPSPADVVNRRSGQSINAAAASSPSPLETSRRSSTKNMMPRPATGSSAPASGKQSGKFAPLAMLDTHPNDQEEATGLVSPPDDDEDVDDDAETLIADRGMDVDKMIAAAKAAQAAGGMAGPAGQHGAPYPGQGGAPESGPWGQLPSQPGQPGPGQQGGPWGQQPGQLGPGQAPGQQGGPWGQQPGPQPGPWGAQPGQQPGPWGQQPGQPGQQPGPWGQQPGQQPGPWGQHPGQPGQQPGPWGQHPGQPGMPQGYQGQYPVMQNPHMGAYNQHMAYTGGMPRQKRAMSRGLMIAIAVASAGLALGAIILVALLL